MGLKFLDENPFEVKFCFCTGSQTVRLNQSQVEMIDKAIDCNAAYLIFYDERGILFYYVKMSELIDVTVYDTRSDVEYNERFPYF